MKRRLTAILIILCMAFALLPATVLAADEPVTYAYNETDFIKGLDKGGTIELENNINIVSTKYMYMLPYSVTIHGNGYKLTLNDDFYFYVGSGITLTLGKDMPNQTDVDLTIKGKNIKNEAHNLIVVMGGSLTAKHVVMSDRYMAYNGSRYRTGAAIHAEAAESIVLENCTIKSCKAESDSAFYIDMRSSTADDPTVRITDCVIENNVGVTGGTESIGGRIMFRKGSLTLHNTTVQNNTVPNYTKSRQTAFHIEFEDTDFHADIKNCKFVNNTSEAGVGGLEIVAGLDNGRDKDKDFSNCLTMKNCTITGNVSTNGEIGGLWIITTPKTVFDLTENVICNNKAKFDRRNLNPSDVGLSEITDSSEPHDTAKFPEPVGMQQKTADGKEINAWFMIATGNHWPPAVPTQIVDLDHVKSTEAYLYYAGHVTPTYELRYEGNDPEGSTVGNLPSTQTEATDDASVTFTISTQEPTCSDYRFTGWTVAGDTSGTVYQPGDPITVTVPVTTLLAQWEKDIPDAPADPAALLKVRVLCDANDSHEEQIYDLLTGDTVTLGTVEPTEDGTYQLSGSITYADVEQYVGLYSAEYGSHRLEEEKGSNAFTLKWNKETRTWELTSCATIVVACGDGYNPVLPLLPLLRGQGVPRLNTADHFAYVQGYTDGTVRPNGNITRAETAAILFRLMDDDTRRLYYSTSAGFRDVDSSKWYNTYVATLNNAGVITDSANGSFRPDDAITRAELAAMLAQFAEQKTAVNYFSDVISRNRYANAIALTASLGWINGYPDGTFRPNQSITRAELMAIINRATNRAPKSTEALLAGMNTWTDNMDTSAWYYLDVQEATNSHTYMGNPTEYWTGLEADPDWSQYE